MSDNKFKKLIDKKKMAFHDGLRNAKQMKFCYVFLAPFAILFITFTILPILTSVYYSFTNFNILEKPEWVGIRNYINLFLQDDVNTIAIKNTFLMAVIIGPVGFILAFVVAWLINELPKWLRAVFVLFFYAPSISGGAIGIFTIMFRDDAQGWVNSILIRTGIITSPLSFFTNPSIGLKVIIPICLWASMGAGFLSFVAGLKGIEQSQYEAGYIDGIQNRWQELWYITLPNMKPMLLFGAVMAITGAFSVGDVPRALAGYPSTDYYARTVLTHLFDYGYQRFEMGYASAIAALLFIVMLICNKAFQSILNRVGQ